MHLSNIAPLEVVWTLIALPCVWLATLAYVRTRRRVQRIRVWPGALPRDFLILGQDRRTARCTLVFAAGYLIIGLTALAAPAAPGNGLPGAIIGAVLITHELWLLVTVWQNDSDRSRLFRLLDDVSSSWPGPQC